MSPLHDALQLLLAVTARTTRRLSRGARDAGASALEFAIIAAIVVVAASLIGGVIFNIVKDKSTKLDTCAKAPIGSPACAP